MSLCWWKILNTFCTDLIQTVNSPCWQLTVCHFNLRGYTFFFCESAASWLHCAAWSWTENSLCLLPLLAAAGTAGAASTMAHLAQKSATWKVMLNLHLICLSPLIQARPKRQLYGPFTAHHSTLHERRGEFSQIPLRWDQLSTDCSFCCSAMIFYLSHPGLLQNWI